MTPGAGPASRRPAAPQPDEDYVLATIGLSRVEQELYEALVGRPPMTLTDLARGCGRGHARDLVRAALDRLQNLELVTELLTTPVRYAATPPETALDAMVVARGRELSKARRRMLHLNTRFQQHHAGADDDPDTGDPLIEVVRGRPAMLRFLTELHSSIRRSLLSFDAPPYFGFEVKRAEDAKPGVTYLTLYHRRALASQARVEYIASNDKPSGEDFRVADIPVKMFLVDDRIGFLPLDHVTYPIAAFVVVHDPALLAVLRSLFEIYWEHAVPVKINEPHFDLATQLDDNDRKVLSLLVSGFTDLAIAEELGWTDRTVRQRTSRMLRLLGAETRFQAGYQAVTQGWLGLHRGDVIIADHP